MPEKKLMTVCQKFYSTVDKFPDSRAQIFNPELYNSDSNGIFTYALLKDRVESLSCGLLALGINPQDKIAIMAPTTPYWTQADLAIAHSAAVSVTIYPTLSTNEVSYIMNDSKSRFLFAGGEETMKTIISAKDQMSDLEKIIVLDLNYKSDNDMVVGMSELISMGDEWKKNNYDKYTKTWKNLTLNDGYTILYTSGTTGQGKGVLLTHWSISSRMKGVDDYFAKYGMVIDENDVGLCFLPLSHIFDRGSLQALALYHASCIAYADKPATLLDDMQKYNPTWMNCVPRLYEKIYITFQQEMAASDLKKKIFDWALGVGEQALEYRANDNGCYDMTPGLDLSSRLPFFLKLKFKIADKLFAKIRALFGNRFRYSFSASAGIAPELLKFYYILGLSVVEGYGSTESCNAAVLNPINACKPGYVGQNANGSLSRMAVDGELELSGAGIFKEYLNKPEDTKESFTDDGWFKTGDLVATDDEDYFKIIDRKKAIICTAVGKNIAPAKLENLFSTSSIVEQTFFVGDERNYITALFVPNFNYFIDYFDKNNIQYDKDRLEYSTATGISICTGVGEDFISQSVLKEMIGKEVNQANGKLEKFEQIRRYTILLDRFTEENGQITPTQKTKKRVLLQTYADLIEKMYE